MGYSDDHDLQWDDFQCDSYISSGLRVGFMCEQTISTTQGELNTSFQIEFFGIAIIFL